MEILTLKIMVMDFSKVQIMSRGVEVDRAWMDTYRIRHIYNKIESIDVQGLSTEEVHRVTRERMHENSGMLIYRTERSRGNVMLAEGGLKDVKGGQVFVTTMFHFEDVYSMEMFVMRYPHKTWDHMKDLYVMTN